jgi:hypothetical protein
MEERVFIDVLSLNRYVLDQVLSGEPTEIVVENIHEYLTTVGENVRNGSTKLEEFIIFKASFIPAIHSLLPGTEIIYT